MSLPRTGILLLVVPIGLMAACGVRQWEPLLLEGPAPPPSGETPYLKAHMTSGELVVFSGWEVPSEADTALIGHGWRYSVDLVPGPGEPQSIPLDSIALLESNQEETVSRFGFSGLMVWTALSTIQTAVCVADPKSCFGSCPTFYLEDRSSETLVAEGFSASVARVFEAHDVDALPDGIPSRGGYTLVMRNEAPETHAVRWIHLLAVPKPAGRAVHATTVGTVRFGSHVYEPSLCRLLRKAGEGDCTEAVREADGVEHYTTADSLDLAARELVVLEFPSVPDGTELGLLVRGRASLLSTFLFYQTIAYVGEEAGSWLGALERGDPALATAVTGIPDALGGVEVEMERDGTWVNAGSFGEPGPIAADEQVVELPSHGGGPVRVRLRMAKGAWRLDRIGLVALEEEVEPLILQPTSVEPVAGGTPGDVALDRLLDPDRYLVTQRGDAYRIRFQLPAEHSEYAVFLDSRGYYYEWMREEWVRETDPAMAALIFTDPSKALRRLAPVFKAQEAGMEETFWSSRFRRNH